MKKIIILALSIICSISLFAERKYDSTVNEKASKMTQQMKVELNLKPSQVSELHAVNLEVVKRLNTALTISNSDSLKRTVQSINVYRDNELKKILTSQQYAYIHANVNGRNCH
jgi:hypothetical protein